MFFLIVIVALGGGIVAYRASTSTPESWVVSSETLDSTSSMQASGQGRPTVAGNQADGGANGPSRSVPAIIQHTR